MNWEPLTLGERMVMIARIAAAEHVRQAVDAAGADSRQPEAVLRVVPETAAAPDVAPAPGTFCDNQSITLEGSLSIDERDTHRESA